MKISRYSDSQIMAILKEAKSVSIEIGSVLKGKSSHKLLLEFAVLKRPYWVASSGNSTDKV